MNISNNQSSNFIDFNKINSSTNKSYSAIFIDTDYKIRKIDQVIDFIAESHKENPDYRVLYLVARKILVLERHAMIASRVPPAVVAMCGIDDLSHSQSQMLICHMGALENLETNAPYDLIVCEEVNGIMRKLAGTGELITMFMPNKTRDIFKRNIDTAHKRTLVARDESDLVHGFVSSVVREDILWYSEQQRSSGPRAKLVDEEMLLSKLKQFSKHGKRCLVCCGTRQEAEIIYRLHNSPSFPVLLLTSQTADEHRDTILNLKNKIADYKMIVYTTSRAPDPDVCAKWADLVFSYACSPPKHPFMMFQAIFSLHKECYLCIPK